MPNLMFYSKFVYKVNAAVRSNFDLGSTRQLFGCIKLP